MSARIGICALLAAVLPAAELGPPAAIAVHPDGARLTWTVAVPPEGIAVDLPPAPAGTIAVVGAAWHLDEVWPAPPAPPAQLAELLAERNRLADAAAAQAAADGVIQAGEARIAARLPALDPADPVERWLPAIDAALARRAAASAAAAALAAARSELRRRAEALGPAAADALALDRPGRRDAGELSAAWAGAAAPAAVRRLRLDRPGGGPADVRLTTRELRWTPSAVLLVDGGAARLIRRASLAKPPGYDLPPVPVTALAQPLDDDVAGPGERPVELRLRDRPSSSQVIGATVMAASAPVPRAAPAERVADPAAATPARPPAPPADPPASDLAPERWDLGRIALPRDRDLVVADLPAEALALEDDRWELAPQRAAIAQRLARLRLAGRGLQPGRLTAVVDGAAAGSAWTAGAAPGGAIDLRLAEDAGIFVADPQRWPPGDGEWTPSRRKEGWTWTIRHRGAQPRRIRFAVGTAVSALDEVAVTLLPATSPGSSEPRPGLRTWELDLKPGDSTAIGIGWMATARGGFALP